MDNLLKTLFNENISIDWCDYYPIGIRTKG